MDYKLTPYVSKIFNSDILSYLNVDTEGDVVSAQVWKALWSNVLNFTQQLDTHMTELLSQDGIITKLVTDHNKFITDHATILAAYESLKPKFDTLDKSVTAAQNAAASAAFSKMDAEKYATALAKSFVHYGNNAPINPYIKLWIRPSVDTDVPATLADVNAINAILVNQYYTKAIVDAKHNQILDLIKNTNTSFSNYYTKAECDAVFIQFDNRIREAANSAIAVQQALVNYYTKSEVDDKIANAGGGGGNVDLTDYVKKTDYAVTGGSVGGVVKLNATYCVAADKGVLRSVVKNSTDYEKMVNTAFISKGTLNNILADKIGDIETLLGGI